MGDLLSAAEWHEWIMYKPRLSTGADALENIFTLMTIFRRRDCWFFLNIHCFFVNSKYLIK